MKQPKYIINALEVLKKRVRYEKATIRLPGSRYPTDDTLAIKEATKVYVESWVIPIIEAIIQGDKSYLEYFCQTD